MSRKVCKRRARPAEAPAIVKLATNPEIAIAERMAVEALRGGYFEYHHYRVLSDCHSHLTLAARKRKDDSASSICEMGRLAILNIYDRRLRTQRYGATGEELQALMIMVDFAEDFWKRQSGALLNECIAITSAIRRQQLAESNKKVA